MSRVAITDLTHRYADAVVRRDADAWAATWATDAVWELGKGRRVEGREAILGLWNSAMDGFKAVVQNVVNSTATLDDAAGTGSGRCYIMEHWWRADDSKGILLAYYDDLYTRVDDEWLFASRELVIQYGGPPDLSAPFQNAWA
jgi:hypothetical protein